MAMNLKKFRENKKGCKIPQYTEKHFCSLFWKYVNELRGLGLKIWGKPCVVCFLSTLMHNMEHIMLYQRLDVTKKISKKDANAIREIVHRPLI